MTSLQTALNIVSAVIPKRPTCPIMEYLKLDTGFMTASDLKHFVTIKVDDCITTYEPFCALYLTLKGQVGAISKTKNNPFIYNTTADSNTFSVEHNGGRSELTKVSADEFPETPCIDTPLISTFDLTPPIIEVIKKASKFISGKDWDRFGKVFFNLTDNLLVINASDGDTLFSESFPLAGNDVKFCLSKTTIELIKKSKITYAKVEIYGYKSDEVVIRWESDDIIFQHYTDIADFPLTNKSQNSNGLILIDPVKLRKTIESVYSSAVKDCHNPHLTLECQGDKLSVRYQAGLTTLLDYQGEIAIDAEIQGELTITYQLFDAKKLIDILKQCNRSEIGIKLGNKDNACQLIDGQKVFYLAGHPERTEEQLDWERKEARFILFCEKISGQDSWYWDKKQKGEYTFKGYRFTIAYTDDGEMKANYSKEIKLIGNNGIIGFYYGLGQPKRTAFELIEAGSEEVKCGARELMIAC